MKLINIKIFFFKKILINIYIIFNNIIKLYFLSRGNRFSLIHLFVLLPKSNMPTTCFNFDKSPGFCIQPKVLFAIFKHTP